LQESDRAQHTAERRLIATGLLLAMAVVAIEVTVVSTAMPTVIGELHGLELYPWVFSAYLLTSTVTVPIFGKLADLYGRKMIFLGGMSLFLLGSVLCGLASSMPLLVGFRALQGLGAGAVQPMLFTIIGDVYPLRERGKIQGFMGGLWGIASVLGPGLGAFLTVAYSWRFVFFVGVPFALLSLVIIWSRFHERLERRPVTIDYAGAGTLSAGLLLLMLTVLEGGRSLAWGSASMLALGGLSLGLLGAFLLIERRANEPLIPLGIFRLRPVSVGCGCNFFQGAQVFALSAYIPLYVQGVLGEGAAGAGAAMTPLLLGWALSAFVGPRMLLRLGFRTTGLIGSSLIVLGSLPLLVLDASLPRPILLGGLLIAGAGFGPSTAAFQVAVQSAVSWELRGVVTSTTQLARSLGGTIGVALCGALLAARLQASSSDGMPERAALLDPAARENLAPTVLASLQSGLAAALQPVFIVIVTLGALCLLIVLRFATNAPIQAAAPSRADEGAHQL
jgi:EmrB/QacA subfamily drug resistance transporter